MVGESFSAKEMVINIGDEADCMFFIMMGAVEVVGPSGEVYATITSGSFFGEVGIFFNVKRTASIRAQDDLILFKLTKQAVLDVSENYPSFQRRIKEEASHRFAAFKERASEREDGKVELFDVEVSEIHLNMVLSGLTK